MKKIIIGLLLLVTLSGCVFTPVMDMFHQSGAGAEDRQALLPRKIKSFYADIIGDRFLNFNKYLAKDNRDELLKYLRENRKVEKVIEGKLDFVDFDKKSKKATVDIIVSSYRIPYYVVKERIERQIWVFSGSSDGWKLKSIEIQE